MKRELYKIWKRYINKPIYRIIPERDYKIILKKGLDPKKDPYEKIRPKLNKLFKIILNLEKKGKMIKLKWGSKEVYGSYIVKTTKDDLLKYYIDFTPNKKDIKYYSMMVGGAIVNNIKRLTKKLIETNIEISNKNLKIINELNRWAKSKKCENKVI